MNKIGWLLLPCLVVFLPSETHAEEDFVKKSTNGFCHYKTSDFFERTRRFKRFETLAECLVSGGKIPPVSQNNQQQPQVKFSRTRLCHEKGGAHYEQTKTYVAFGSIEDCVRHGGSN